MTYEYSDSYVVDYRCPWFCRVEVELGDGRYNYQRRSMRGKAGYWHACHHKGEPINPLKVTITSNKPQESK